MKPPRLNIYIVDDDEDVRRSLVMLLHAQGHAMQAFESGEAFLAQVDVASQYGCAVLDLRMQGMSGIEVFDQLLARRSPLVVLFLSGHGDIELALEQVKKGACDWIPKPSTPQVLAKLTPALELAAQRAVDHQRWSTLTDREREVVKPLARGLSSREIARLLKPEVGFRVVDTYRARIFEKLQVANATELAVWVARNGWLLREDPPHAKVKP
ncbi:MAG: response regulator transcription factor [Burkholderiales bacterium]|nr:response regulator transcription factor [Burkholderiales bacterium]